MTLRPEPLTFLQQLSALCRTDFYAQKAATGYSNLKAAVTDQVLREHLASNPPIAVGLLTGSNTRCAVLDFDDHDGQISWKMMQARTMPVRDALIEEGLKPFAIRSGGGSGIHIWLIWNEPQSAAEVRALLRRLLEAKGFNIGTRGITAYQVEVFPKQDEIAEEEVGSLIALPFARASLPLDHEFNPVSLGECNLPQLGTLFSQPVPETIVDRRAHQVQQALERQILPGDDELARAALKHIEAEDYDFWVRAGFALKSAFGADGFAIWHEWSKICEAKYSGEVACKKKWDSFKPAGRIGLGTIFHEAKKHGWNGPGDQVIREMNAQYGILTQGRETRIIEKMPFTQRTDLLISLNPRVLHDRYCADKIPITDNSGSTKQVIKSKYWFEHPQAARYTEVIFDPSKQPGENGMFWNLWRGFAFEPQLGDWSLLQGHILQNICKGDPKQSEWLLNWMALAVQQANKPIGTAPVLKGLPGTGKSFLANQFAALWHPHSIEVTHPKHVLGNFNAHLYGCRFIFVDEGTFGGDKASMGVIKTRISEPHILIEAKGVDATQMRNHTIWMIASNNESIIAADRGDRRFMVFEVSNSRKEDHGYFEKIQAQMEQGGYSAMLYDLLHRDIKKGPDPRKIIRTEALFQQVLNSLSPAERYMYQALSEGILGGGGHRMTSRAMLEDLQQTYHDGRYETPERLGRTLKTIFGDQVKSKPTGRHNGARTTEYTFGALAVCRKKFEAHIGQAVEWPHEPAEWVEDDNLC